MTERKKVVAVIGAGLVGSLEACYLAKRGYEVHVYEYREDIRKMEHVAGRSINLAMSVRGLGALRKIGLDDHIREEYGIPMHARMIHSPDGDTNAIPYGKANQCIYSVGRRYVNEILLDEGSKYEDIKFHFNHKLLKTNLEKPELTFERMDTTDPDTKFLTVTPDLVIGCDGAYSAVRKEMMKKPRFNYSQTYIPHAYMELCMPQINGDFFSNRALPLVSVKCFPYNISGKAVIMGDAAHAMVPFYGQGMNCGMEDCLVLEDALEKYPINLEKSLDEFSKNRNPDAEAMCDLAMYNYIEMRDLVNKKSFLVRKKLDNLLHWLLPNFWVPLYTSVTFSRMRYHHCVSNREWQDSVLNKISALVGISSLVGVFLLAKHNTCYEASTKIITQINMKTIEKFFRF